MNKFRILLILCLSMALGSAQAQELYPANQLNINLGYGSSMPEVSNRNLSFSSENSFYLGYSWNIQIGDNSSFYIHLSDLIFSATGMSIKNTYPSNGQEVNESLPFRNYCFGGFGVAYYIMPEFYVAASARPYLIRNSRMSDFFGETLTYASAEVSYRVAERLSIFGRFQQSVRSPEINFVSESGTPETSTVTMRLAHLGLSISF